MAARKPQTIKAIPLIPLRDVVMYPETVLPLAVGRKESLNGLELAMNKNKRVFLVSQKTDVAKAPTKDDLYGVGVMANVLQMLRLPDGTVKVLVEGLERAELQSLKKTDMYIADVKTLQDKQASDDRACEKQMEQALSLFSKLIDANKKIPPEVLTTLENIREPGPFADATASHVSHEMEMRQTILETLDVRKRLTAVIELLHRELSIIEVDQELQVQVEGQIKKNQKQYILTEKIKAIHSQLGEMDDGAGYDEIKKYETQIEALQLSEEAREKATSELSKLKMMAPMSAEATVSRNYLDWLLGMPWGKNSALSSNMVEAKDILDEDHYGLDKIKERILEFLAVQSRVGKVKGPILCLVGPPGVGKTSLGQSVARATGREFARIAFGGVRDEAEVRGHRRTYIGALPGKIVQKLSKLKVDNPLFMLDELDKMSKDFRGDPASAMLEVLDPEQNSQFSDHYLEVDYDLSNVMFVATANSLDIPPALLDRLEVISIPGYTEQEKLEIAKRFLVPKQLEAAGLKKSECKISKSAVVDMIRYYTREAGVRNLERAIAKVARKVVKEILTEADVTSISVTQKNLEKYLGVRKHRFSTAEKGSRVGHVTGLAWTQVGGEILTIEAQAVPGKGKSLYTGSLGDVMQESISAAMTVVRARTTKLGIPADFYASHDFHVHVPEGATPKDGPSAGIGMCTALVSALTGIPVCSNVAMTGEITLRGEVLPIGGLKEKLLAALRGNIRTVIIPDENQRDLMDVPAEVLEQLDVRPVRWIDEVLLIALKRMPKPLSEDATTIKVDLSQKSRQGKRGGELTAH